MLLTVNLVVGLGLVLLSPLALGLLDEAGSRNWTRLSEIGQTYGAVSALLSGMALGAVALSLVVQLRGSHLDRLNAHRQHHFELLRMAIDDPDLRAVWVSPEIEPGEQRQRMYCNLVTWWWEMSFDVGAVSEQWIRNSADELFQSSAGRHHWAGVRVRRSPAVTRRGRLMRKFVDEQWQLAVGRELAEKGSGGCPSEEADELVEGTDRSIDRPAEDGAPKRRPRAGRRRRLRRRP